MHSVSFPPPLTPCPSFSSCLSAFGCHHCPPGILKNNDCWIILNKITWVTLLIKMQLPWPHSRQLIENCRNLNAAFLPIVQISWQWILLILPLKCLLNLFIFYFLYSSSSLSFTQNTAIVPYGYPHLVSLTSLYSMLVSSLLF